MAEVMNNMALTDIQRHCRMGRCCKICDQKFFLRENYQIYSDQISFFVYEIEDMEEQLNIKDNEIDEITREKAAIDAKIKQADKDYDEQDESAKM